MCVPIMGVWSSMRVKMPLQWSSMNTFFGIGLAFLFKEIIDRHYFVDFSIIFAKLSTNAFLCL